jgi:hypothetical protein
MKRRQCCEICGKKQNRDFITDFIDLNCLIGEALWMTVGNLRAFYRAWNGSGRGWNRVALELHRRGCRVRRIRSIHGKQYRTWEGVALCKWQLALRQPKLRDALAEESQESYEASAVMMRQVSPGAATEHARVVSRRAADFS